mmetsp:Transcript_26986/g.26906  ORF Transcript_26986/g.26906 Transcript_26986/m.26906 type:complete len:120 (-) Transcript_26986:192-551(-)
MFLSDESREYNSIDSEEEKEANKLLWDILASQFNTLRKIYREFYNQLDKDTKLSELKLKMKKKSLRGKDSDEEGQENYISEDDQDGKEKEREESKIFIKEMPSPTLLQRSTSVEYELNS